MGVGKYAVGVLALVGACTPPAALRTAPFNTTAYAMEATKDSITARAIDEIVLNSVDELHGVSTWDVYAACHRVSLAKLGYAWKERGVFYVKHADDGDDPMLKHKLLYERHACVRTIARTDDLGNRIVDSNVLNSLERREIPIGGPTVTHRAALDYLRPPQ
jgi:hypothetical protein